MLYFIYVSLQKELQKEKEREKEREIETFLIREGLGGLWLLFFLVLQTQLGGPLAENGDMGCE